MTRSYLQERSPVWEGPMSEQGVCVDTEIIGIATQVESGIAD
jgi:hypothetical protein